MTAPIPQPGILEITPYIPGKGSAKGDTKTIKLSSNETPLGPSSQAIAAYREAADDLARYPEGSAFELRQAIGDVYGINPERVVCGAGSDEILNLLANAYLGPGDEAIYTAYGFLVYKIAILANGATPVVAPEKEFCADVDEILARVSKRTRMVFLANPNNPTGTYVPIDEVRRLRAELPEEVLLVLDAAYGEYVRRNDYEAGFELVATTNNTVMTRTFSKIHGLAALRLGWGYCPKDVADVLNRIRGPFNVNGPAVAAGSAAVKDGCHINAAIEHNDVWLSKVAGALHGLGVEVTPSVANFLLVHFSPTGTCGAAEADSHLQSCGIYLRRVEAYGLPHALRMTIGTEEENRTVIAAFGDLLSVERAG